MARKPYKLIEVLLAGGGVLMLIGLSSTVYAIAKRFDTRAVQSWPSTTGTITQSSMQYLPLPRGKSNYQVILYYTYTVGGKTYTASPVTRSGSGYASEASAAVAVRRYAAGNQVSVFYNPSYPNEAFLEHESMPAGAVFWTFAGPIVVLAGAIGIGVAIWLHLSAPPAQRGDEAGIPWVVEAQSPTASEQVHEHSLAAMNSAGTWFYLQGQQPIGPVSSAELQRLLAQGQLTPTSLVCPAGERQWVEFETVVGLI